MSKPLKFVVAGSIVLLSSVAWGDNLTSEQLGFSKDQTRESVLAACKHIAIIPVPVPAIPGGDPAVSAHIEAIGTRALQKVGFDVISTEAYSNARQQVIAQAGGAFNPGTGQKRSDVVSKALDAGMKALLSNSQMDCFATIHAERSKAMVFSRYAIFYGAKEYTDGGNNGTLSSILLGKGGTGQIGALSLALRIYDRNYKQLYGRFGGVQLTTYLDRQHGNNQGDYLFVPLEALLQDDQRLDRALTYATVPFRLSPEQMDAGKEDPKVNSAQIDPDVFSKPPAGVHNIYKPLLAPREQILGSVHRVVIGTLAPNGLTNSPEVVARYQSLVHERLAKLGWEVIDSAALNVAFGMASQQVGGIYDPFTGKTDPARLQQMMQVALTSLGLPAKPDGVALISLLKTGAVQVAGNVDWDGTTQSALTLGPVIDKVVAFGGTTNQNAGEGGIAAASFNFALRDANGTLLVDSLGGIQLLQKLTLQGKHEHGSTTFSQTYTDLTPADLFTDPARDAHAVDVALSALLPPTTVAREAK
jgi:hypothetical protein